MCVTVGIGYRDLIQNSSLSMQKDTVLLIDGMQLQIGSTEAWLLLLWVAVEPVHRVILGVYISRHRNVLAVEAFLSQMINRVVWKIYSIFR